MNMNWCFENLRRRRWVAAMTSENVDGSGGALFGGEHLRLRDDDPRSQRVLHTRTRARLDLAFEISSPQNGGRRAVSAPLRVVAIRRRVHAASRPTPKPTPRRPRPRLRRPADGGRRRQHADEGAEGGARRARRRVARQDLREGRARRGAREGAAPAAGAGGAAAARRRAAASPR